MRAEAAIIGGTGIGERLANLGGRSIHVPAPFGVVRGRLAVVDGATLFLTSRHSAGHKVPPHRVNYRGLASACAALGVRACFATAAVGSLRADWPTGTMSCCSDFFDVSARNVTLFDRTVEHTDFTQPFNESARQAVLTAANALGAPIYERGIYINGPGPRYETPHEIQVFKNWGDVVGMTAGSEAVAMREAAVPYACLAIVTNLACGIAESELNHQEVVDEMNRSGAVAVDILLGAVRQMIAHG